MVCAQKNWNRYAKIYNQSLKRKDKNEVGNKRF